MGRLGRGWELAKMSLGVIKKDKEILIFPFLSLVCMGIVVTGFIGGTFLAMGNLDSLVTGDFYSLTSPTGIAAVASAYFLLYFITVYFNVAVIGCAMIRFEGGDPRVGDGFRISNRNLRSILKWTLIAATVGMILRVIEKKFKGIGGIIAGIAGMAWSVATFFAVPVFIYEKTSLRGAIARSARILKQTWGEMIAGGLGLGVIFLLLGLAGIVPLILGIVIGAPLIGFIIAISYWLVLVCIGSAADSALKVALYRYATTGKVAPGFTEETFRRPWGKQGKPSWRATWWPMKPGEI